MKTAMLPGTEAVVTGLCGAQFTMRPLRVRLIKVLDYITLGPDLVWVDVYELNRLGFAHRQRELLVIRDAFEAACVRGATKRQQRSVSTQPSKEACHAHVR